MGDNFFVKAGKGLGEILASPYSGFFRGLTKGATDGAISSFTEEGLPEILGGVKDLLGHEVYAIEQLEGSANNVLDNFFNQLNSAVGGDLASVGSSLISQGTTAALTTTVVGGAVTLGVGGALMIGNTLAKNHLINKVDKKYKENLSLTFDEINRAREEAIVGLRTITSQVDQSLENRINQISLIIMKTLTEFIEIAEEFTPDAFRTRLVEPALKEINNLKAEFFKDLDKKIDKFFDRADKFRDQVDQMLMGTLEEVRNDLIRRREVHAIPNPLDPCRKKLNISSKRGIELSDIELYRLIECHELAKVNENTPLEQIIETYAQLQLNAIRMASLSRKAPQLREIVIRDWVKYGMLCEFWKVLNHEYAPSYILPEGKA